jgi:hypothetical protein
MTRGSLFLNGPVTGMMGSDRKESATPMNGFDSPAVLWLLVAAQLFGFASAWAARLSEGSRSQALGQWLFFGTLPLMGAVTMASLAVGPGCWLACSTTLAVMVLTVTCDFRGSREAATW